MYEEVGRALRGEAWSMERVNERGELIISVAVPIQRYRAVLGALTTLVALDLLPDLLVQGPPVVPVDVVAGVRRLLTGQLLGAWRVDAAQPADTIVLCDPTQATTSPT